MDTNVSMAGRFVGVFIDSIVASIPACIIMFLAGMLNIGALLFVGYLVFLALFLLRDALFGGQSIGKKVMKYKAVKADGSSLAGDYAASLIRNVSIFIPFVDCYFVITDKPRLGDNWAGTKVVNQ